MQMLGVDIGGSGIKGCLVDTETGELIGERHRIATPQPATPAAVAHTLKALVEHFQWKGPVGCGVHFGEYSACQAACIHAGSANQHL